MSSGSFAAAQSRILARQQARLAEAQARNPAPTPEHAATTAPPSTTLARLTSPLTFLSTSPKYSLTHLTNIILSSDGTQPALRVGQVDAELLDAELISLLKSQINDGLKYYGAHLQDDWSHEIHLALRAILFKLSIWDNNASYGAALQGLQYSDARSSDYDTARRVLNPSRWQKSALGFITVLGKYAWDKWEDYLLDAEGSYDGLSERLRTLSTITTRLTTVHSLAALTSFCVFLVNGKYRTLTDRLLRLRLVSPTNQTSREVSFEYLNRQLVWHAFTEFLLFLLPLVGISRWRRWISRAWRNAKRSLTQSSTDTSEQDPEKIKTGPLAFLPERTCAICYQDQNPTSEADALKGGAAAAALAGGGGVQGSATTDIVNPYETVPCACIYCFVCLATKIEAEEGAGWPCLRCGEVVLRCRPWSGDVIVERRRDENKGGKSVGFAQDHDHGEEAQDAGPGPAVLRSPSGEVLYEQQQEEAQDLGASKWQLEGA